MRVLLAALGLLVAVAWPALAADPAPQPAPITLDQIHRLMTGTWQNTADTRFTRQLNADGTSVDRYEGDESATSVGTWKLFEGTALPRELAARKVPAEGLYMTLAEHGDLYLFAVTAVAPQAMEMINIDRRQALRFERLK